MTNQKDYVKDIEKKDNLDSSLQSIEWIDKFNFKQFDEEIEKSFQDFLRDKKMSLLAQLRKKPWIQYLIIGWIVSLINLILLRMKKLLKR